jgi:hypothetical protein
MARFGRLSCVAGPIRRRASARRGDAMKDVLVALWSRETHEPRKMLAHTIFPLSLAIKRARERAESLVKQRGNLQSVFVAPEFLFTAPEYSPGSTGMSLGMRNWVLEKLKKLSQDNPNMLLVPGTIVFKERITQRSARRAILNLEHAFEPKPLMEARKLPIKPYLTYESTDKTIKTSQDLYRSQIDELTRYEQNQVSRMPSSGASDFLIKNRTYVFFSGEKKFSYGKKCNMGDFNNDSDKGIFVPGRHEGVTTIDGLKVGFEVCLDHSLGTLKNHLLKPDLDLHVIASAEVNNNPSEICVAEGGYLIHASANDKFSKVMRKLPIKERKSNPDPFQTQKVKQQRPGRVDVTTFEVGDSSSPMAGGGDILEVENIDNNMFQVLKPLESIEVDKGLLKFYLLKNLK